MAESFLDRFGHETSCIRHPAWRIYKALELVHDPQGPAPSSTYSAGLTPNTFGLKGDIEVYYPYSTPDDLIIELTAAMTDPNYSDSMYCLEPCFSLFLDTNRRQVIEGMLMDGRLPEDIAVDMGVTSSFVSVYSQAFFDISVWRSAADKLHYIYKGTIGKDAEIKKMIDTEGLEYVLVNRYHMPDKLKLERCLSTMFGYAYQQTIKYLQADSTEDQKIAQDWTKQTLNVYDKLKNATASEGGIRELKIALETHHAPRKSIADLD